MLGIKQSTMNNCWQNTGILPVETTPINANEMEIDEIDEAMANLILALDNLKLADPLVNITANEYVE